MIKYLLLYLVVFASFISYAQPTFNHRFDASSIQLDIKNLGVIANVMYIAAHPDDENTRMIAYLAKEKGYKTSYLSLTRGDGGQNLIGKEVGEDLGLIRTYELLAARKIDGGHQLFSRAKDFGYSKHPEETLSIWDKDSILSDVVWAIRKFRPDVIITRFSPDRAGKTHGHHTTSARLAVEGFKLAAAPNAFPEQLKYVSVWKTKRIFWNTSWWFFRSEPTFDKTSLLQIDVGVFNPFIGQNYGEVAAHSRTKHKSQGFGSAISRGENIEYLQALDGLGKPNSLFENIQTSWSRLNMPEIDKTVQHIYQSFNPAKPYESLNDLLALYTKLSAQKDNYWVAQKLENLESIILRCAGFWAELVSSDYSASAGERIDFELRSMSPYPVDIKIEGLQNASYSSKLDSTLAENKMLSFKDSLDLKDMPISQPYWLEEKGTKGIFSIPNQEDIGLAEKPTKVSLELIVSVQGLRIKKSLDILYRWVDPVKGELYRNLEVRPKVSLQASQPVYLFTRDHEVNISMNLVAHTNYDKNSILISEPKGWRISPRKTNYKFEKKHQERKLTFHITPPSKRSQVTTLKFMNMDDEYLQSWKQIAYDHIPQKSIFNDLEIKLVYLDLDFTPDKKIAYIKGSGDFVGDMMGQLGYKVDYLEDEDIDEAKLKDYDVLIFGIRAYNTRPRLFSFRPVIMKYIEQGGHVIVQYNTSRRLKGQIGPYPFKLSRDRITVEEAPITFLNPEHPLLNTPNQISKEDLDNWVQERGLYFASEWDEHYTSLFSGNDPGEAEKKGGFLVCEYGEGSFIYSGYSWFRQLPAGVLGALKIFINMVEYETKEDEK